MNVLKSVSLCIHSTCLSYIIYINFITLSHVVSCSLYMFYMYFCVKINNNTSLLYPAVEYLITSHTFIVLLFPYQCFIQKHSLWHSLRFWTSLALWEIYLLNSRCFCLISPGNFHTLSFLLKAAICATEHTW